MPCRDDLKVPQKRSVELRCFLFSLPDDTRSDLTGIWFISHANDGNLELTEVSIRKKTFPAHAVKFGYA